MALKEIYNQNLRQGNDRPKGGGTKEKIVKDYIEKILKLILQE